MPGLFLCQKNSSKNSLDISVSGAWFSGSFSRTFLNCFGYWYRFLAAVLMLYYRRVRFL